jgi:polar amino acid transport system substrate-binding protein
MDASFPPFETVDDKNNFAGYDVELGQMLAEQFGGRAEFVNVGFDGLIDALKAEKFDVIISGFPFDPLLTQDVAYSYNYFNAGQVLVVRGDETRIRGVDDLGGKRVAVELGSGGDIEGRKLAKRLKLTLATYDDPQAVLDALRNGQADAAIVDAVTAYSAAKSPSAVRVIGEPITDEPYVIVVRLKSFKLLERINGAILQMRQDGTLERLRAKWLQE